MEEQPKKPKYPNTKYTDEIISVSLTSNESFKLIEKTEDKIDLDTENAILSLQTRREKKTRRERWDTMLFSLVVIGFVTSYILIIMIGSGLLSFGNNAFAVPSIVAAGVFETYGLAKLAIQYFFNDDDMRK